MGMDGEQQEHEDIKKFLEENKKLLEENNKILKQVRRHLRWGFWSRIVWYCLLLGIPFALYIYFYPIFVQYFQMVGSDYEKFQEGLRELPGFKGFENSIN